MSAVAAVASPPDAAARAAARAAMDGLAKPPGSLGRLEDLAVWWAGVRGDAQAAPPRRPVLAVFAADHGVTARGVSAYPSAVTAAMVTTMLGGGAAASVLAREHGVRIRLVDVAVDTQWPTGLLPAEVTDAKAGRGSAPLDTEDALSPEVFAAAFAAGRDVADDEIDAGADLLLTGDLGIGNTTPSATVIAALTGADATAVAGRGTGIDDAGLERKRRVIAAALARIGAGNDPLEVLRRVGGADLAALAGLCLQAAARRTPVLLDGVIAGAAALAAARCEVGTTAWLVAGHRSAEPAHGLALDALGLQPILALDMRLGEGTGALLALPILRSAVTLLREMATLADVLAGVPADATP